jgi:hypothetical protein
MSRRAGPGTITVRRVSHMARIQTGTPGRLLRSIAKMQYGYMPGITQVLWPDFRTTVGVGIIYSHLHLGKSSKMTRLQREMIATVVNGRIGGAP